MGKPLGLTRWICVLCLLAAVLAVGNALVWIPLRQPRLEIPDGVAYIEEVYERGTARQIWRAEDPALVAQLCDIYRGLYLRRIPERLAQDMTPELGKGGYMVRFCRADGAELAAFCYDFNMLADDRGRVYYVSCGEAEGYYPLGLQQQWIAEAFAVEKWIEQN